MTPLAKLVGRRKGLSITLTGEPERNGDDWFYPVRSTGSAVNETVDSSFDSYVDHAMKENGVVFACMMARQLPFSEARFQYREEIDGRPGRLHTGPGLGLLARPWPNGTTGELLARMEQDASLAGNAYVTPVGDGVNRRLRRLRPDWVTILTGVRDDRDGSPWDLDAEVLGYFYHPGGDTSRPVLLSPSQVAHYSPVPDPAAQWRGMSWLTPLVREVQADTYATKHKLRFFEQGATLSVVVSYDKDVSPVAFERYVALFDQAHRGAENAYRTLHLGGGADATIVGTDLKQIDFKQVQGAGESRIAAAAGVGAIIARFSEGLAGSSLNAGNYAAAKRQFADMTLRPLWRMAAGALEKFTTPPPGSHLWYDARDIEFLKEDQRDAADILQVAASTINVLVSAGYSPDAVVDAVEAGDLSRLAGKHSGLFSVQLQAVGGGGESDALSVAEQLQKLHLAVGKVITSDEARTIVGLSTPGPDFTPAPTPAPKAVAPPPVKDTQPVLPLVFNINMPENAVPPEIVFPKQQAPIVNVAAPVVNVTTPAPKATHKTIVHDENGRIVGITEQVVG